MTMERRASALNELSAPLGALIHTVNNALAIIATTTYALQLEQRLSDEDADALLSGIDTARAAFSNFDPIVRSRTKVEVAVVGVPVTELSSTLSALTGRAIAVTWRDLPPPVTDLTGATRRLIAALWTAADDLDATSLFATASVSSGCVRASVQAADGRQWGPVDIGVAAA